MPRTQRKPSSSNIYHVMVRGIIQLQLFYDDEDRRAFLASLEKLKEGGEVKLYAWSLMDNHVHLPVQAPLEDLGRDELALVVPRLRSEGISIRQIARLTGLSRGIVERLRPSN